MLIKADGHYLLTNGSRPLIGDWDAGPYTITAHNFNVPEGYAYLFDGVQALRLAKGSDTVYASTLVGFDAGNGATSKQTAIGYSAGKGSTKDAQTAVGYWAGRENTDAGTAQTVIGYTSGYKNTGAFQSAIGYYAGRENIGGSQTAIGAYAGYLNTGHRVIGLGYEATRGNSGDDVIAIGYQAGKDNTLANQFIVQQAIKNSTPLIQGDFVTGNVAIGKTTQDAKLDVAGTFQAVAFCDDTNYDNGNYTQR